MHPLLYLKPKSKTAIQYVVITETENNNFTSVPIEFNNEILDLLREFPKDLLQLDSPVRIFSASISNHLKFGLDVFFLPDEKIASTPKLSILLDLISSENQIVVFLVDASSKYLKNLFPKIKSTKGIFYYSLYSQKQDNAELNKIKQAPNYFEGYKELIQLIRRDLEAIVKLNPELKELEFDYNTDSNMVNRNNYYYSLTSLTNYCTLNQIIGNHWKHLSRPIIPKPEERTNILINQCLLLDSLVHHLYLNGNLKKPGLSNPYYESLLLIAPFHNPSVSKIRSNIANSTEVKAIYENGFSKYLLKILNSSQNLDYLNIFSVPENHRLTEEQQAEAFAATGQFTQTRLKYLDAVAYLHASFSYSPVIRLPLVGTEINKELSFLKPNNFKKPTYKLIKGFGEQLKRLTLKADVEEYIQNRNGQIVAISDMPVEWLSVNGVPLNFTHDICRIPESNYRSLLNNFSKNQRQSFNVSTDIIGKTLVILGASEKAGEDEDFKEVFPIIKELATKIGFKVKRCLSIGDVSRAIEEIKPELLIFDCHGGFDEKTMSSYLIINGQKLTGDEVVKNKISAPLVFLSACNTTPNYGYINLIGEAFFEAGAFSVTTTFTPIEIGSGFVQYVRLINQLKVASQHSIHKNWLEFVAHISRSSLIHEAHLTGINFEAENKEQNEAQYKMAESLTKLMQFSNRRLIFKEYENGTVSFFNNKPITFNKLKGEYLCYSHLGRADLIMFDSWLAENQNL